MWTEQPGDPTAAFGGIMAIGDGAPIQDEKWIPYFMVADADATVARAADAGGSVLIPASDAPPGRLGLLADQFGARFAFLQPAPMAGSGAVAWPRGDGGGDAVPVSRMAGVVAPDPPHVWTGGAR